MLPVGPSRDAKLPLVRRRRDRLSPFVVCGIWRREEYYYTQRYQRVQTDGCIWPTERAPETQIVGD